MFTILAQEVDKNAFLILTEDNIKEIIPTVGSRASFLDRWRKEFGSSSSGIRDSSVTSEVFFKLMENFLNVFLLLLINNLRIFFYFPENY